MNNVNEEVIDKIHKLLKHYEGSKKINSENEALTALTLAKKLMLQYHIDSVEFIENLEQEINQSQADKFSVYAVPKWVCNLINVINNICNCSCVLDKDPQSNGYVHVKVVFVALKDDLEQVLGLYRFFKKTIYRLANEHVKAIGGNYTNWRSFAEGFTSRLLEKSRCVNSDDEFGDVQIDEKIDDLDEEDDEEFSEFVDDDEKIDSNISVANKKTDIEKYLKNVKDKISTYIFENFHAKKEQVRTKTRVLIDSFKCGQINADKQVLPTMKRKQKTS